VERIAIIREQRAAIVERMTISYLISQTITITYQMVVNVERIESILEQRTAFGKRIEQKAAFVHGTDSNIME
jgi:hypothetical protein